jgi:hypothetical protein
MDILPALMVLLALAAAWICALSEIRAHRHE